MQALAYSALFFLNPLLTAQVRNFNLTVQNVTQTSPNSFEFDVYLLDVDPNQEMELGSCQIGLLFNSLIFNEGTISATIDNTNSGLNSTQIFTSTPNIVTTLSGYPDMTLIELEGRIPPGAGSGTIISSSGNGTLLTHFILTNTLNFFPNSTTDLVFCGSSAVDPLFPTLVGIYIGNPNSLLTVTPGENAIVNSNPVLNPVNQDFKILNLTSVILEGLYDGSGTMKQARNETGPQWTAGVADIILIELHNSTSYAEIIYTVTDVPINLNGNATIDIPAIYNDAYYITIKHRNSLETTTVSAVSFSENVINLSYGNPSNIYEGNLGASNDGYYFIYGGDVNQDGSVDSGDYSPVINDAYTYLTGYLHTDIDGNGSIDSGDYTIMINNSYKFIGISTP